MVDGRPKQEVKLLRRKMGIKTLQEQNLVNNFRPRKVLTVLFYEYSLFFQCTSTCLED